MAEVKTFKIVLETRVSKDKTKDREFDNKTALKLLQMRGSRWTVKKGQEYEFNGNDLVKASK